MNHKVTLTFDSVPLTLVTHNGRQWLRASEIACALGYSRTDKVTRIYERHSREFTDSMTCILETPISGFSGITAESRLFSLRGAHLLAMFARTAKGVEFRRWVLDRLEEIEAKQGDEGKSLIVQLYQAAAQLDNQNRYASMCGKGLSQHRKAKPPMVEKVIQLADKIQMKLPLIAA